MKDILENLPYLYGKPVASAKLKAKPEHFVVKEDLGFEFTGEGEHLMVKIRKSGENTSFVANELARFCGVKSKDIGWAGLKDRHAVTEQWLSIHLPKSDAPDFSQFEAMYPTVQVLETSRHNKKLRPGDLQGNYFELTLSEVTDIAALEKRLEQVLESGVPNYFGAQRFGRDGHNVEEARRWGRENVRTRNQNKRSLYLSSARSWIFNLIVGKRIESGCFYQPVAGDILELNAEQVTVNESNLVALNESVLSGEAVITAALAGDNALPTELKAEELEQQILDSEPDLMALIRGNRMRHDRRDILLKPEDLSYSTTEDEVTLKFSLCSGSFATSIVRELVNEIAVERKYD